MSEEVTSGKNPNKKLIVILAVAIVLIAAVIIVFFLNNSKLTATTMRVLRLEGTVSLEENGKEKPVKEDLRLKEGNALNTGDASYASVGLDKYKIITLNEDSRAEFNKLGKKLDLSLVEGSMYVDVQKKLASDETFNIHTSSMIVGIRGTSVLVENKAGVESITVTDGTVHVIGTNSVTGESKEIDVPAGKTITVYLYNNRVVDSIMFELTDANYADLPGFVKDYLRDHPETVERIVEGTSWKAEDLTGSSGEGTPAMTETGEGEAATEGNGEDAGDGGADGADGEAAETGDAAEGAEAEEPATGAETVDGNNATGDTILTPAQIAEARASIVFTNTENGILLLSEGTLFDPAFYAMSNPDVVATYGSSTEALVWHYLHRGKAEGRPPMAPVVTAKEPEIPHFDPNANQTSSSSDDDDDDDDDDSGNNKVTPVHTVYQTLQVDVNPQTPDQIRGGQKDLDDQSGATGNRIQMGIWRDTPSDYTKVFIFGDANSGTQGLIKLPIAVETTGGNVGNFEVSKLNQLVFDTNKFNSNIFGSSPAIGTGVSGSGVKVIDDSGNSVEANSNTMHYILKDSSGNTIYEEDQGQIILDTTHTGNIDDAISTLYP